MTAAGTVYIGGEVTTWLANHFMNNDWAVMLGTMVALALTAIYTRQGINGTFGRRPIFDDTYESTRVRINGVVASPRTAGVVGDMVRRNTHELENTDEQPEPETPRQPPARRRLPMTRRERGRSRARSARRRIRRRELDKNNIKF